MKIKLTEKFKYELSNIIVFISKDKPLAARKFKNDLLKKMIYLILFISKNQFILRTNYIETMFLKDTQ